MSHEELPNAQTAAGRLAVKLQALFDALPEDEKKIMARIVRLAVEHTEVQGYIAGEPAPETGQTASGTAEAKPASPIDEFRANLGLYLTPDN